MNDLIKALSDIKTGGPLKVGQRWTSLRGDTAESLRAIYRAALECDIDQSMWKGEPIPVEHVLIYVQEFTDKRTGELRPDFRLVAITPDGLRATATGGGVVRCFRDLMGMYGTPPWRPPLYLQLLGRTGEDGQPYYLLDLVAGPAGDRRPADENGQEQGNEK